MRNKKRMLAGTYINGIPVNCDRMRQCIPEGAGTPGHTGNRWNRTKQQHSR